MGSLTLLGQSHSYIGGFLGKPVTGTGIPLGPLGNSEKWKAWALELARPEFKF